MSTRKCRGFATEMVERDREAIRESSWIATARSEATEGPERRFVDGDAAVKAGINATASRHREKGSAMLEGPEPASKKQPDAQMPEAHLTVKELKRDSSPA